ncbi:putative C2H2 and C2HC zinc fingers superfamily protein [Hibiscus syriacus]|uniref:C2H2 and C2HC zinc fingers superfamily protein n=1 Tax=Hibiscus syriacus TaxID=106335 RepID=A0A6A2XWM0_HIBSY|nr:putative C2H2 and C2HC zinc fingers superfamily protein [Hibiscus syriacus]
MASLKHVRFLFLVVLCTFPKSSEPAIFPVPQGIKAAYWPSFESFPVSSINTSFFTHIYYAFLLPEPSTFKLDITALDQQKLPEFRSGLNAKYPPVKAILSIGGGGNNPDVFARMARTEQTRGVFINSTIEVARSYRFDGVDLDWEFPATGDDMANLALLFKEWREALENEAETSGKPRLLLTSAVYYSSEFTNYGSPRSYPAHAMAEYLDWASPMCFDYHGKWDDFTGMHSALFDLNSSDSSSHGMGSWIRAGVPPEKLVMGLASYGHTWKLKDANVNANNATVKYDRTTVSYYSYAGGSWIGYDDVKSIKWKVWFARVKGLAGYFFWAVSYDKDWALSRQAMEAWEQQDWT